MCFICSLSCCTVTVCFPHVLWIFGTLHFGLSFRFVFWTYEQQQRRAFCFELGPSVLHSDLENEKRVLEYSSRLLSKRVSIQRAESSDEKRETALICLSVCVLWGDDLSRTRLKTACIWSSPHLLYCLSVKPTVN